MLEYGVYSLTERLANPFTKNILTFKERIDQLVEYGVYADKKGIHVFGLGEHHRLDYAVSSPQMVLAAIAAKTSKIKLTALTSLLNTTDPVRLYEDFATLDLLSAGRSELTIGRGAFVEAFPLFGYNERDYDELFAEHLQLLNKLNHTSIVTWKGRHRSSLNNAEIAPRAMQKNIPISIGVGGTLESAERAANYKCGLTVVMIGGIVKKYKRLVDTYRKHYEGERPFVSIAGHTFIRETEEELEKEFYPYYATYWEHLTKQGIGGAMGVARSDLEFVTSKESTLIVGTPKQIIEKIQYQKSLFQHQRFYAQVDFGGQSTESVKKTIDLLTEEVMPYV
jgi:alkanesulfonate monooxygenase SsuD/methylene tetrahydromethanopterin reductase-like flavin-dependent oxidoreductase (luciferase family)